MNENEINPPFTRYIEYEIMEIPVIGFANICHFVVLMLANRGNKRAMHMLKAEKKTTLEIRPGNCSTILFWKAIKPKTPIKPTKNECNL